MSPDPSRLPASELATALRALPYRQSAFLMARLVQARGLEDCAALYGITPEAFSVHQLRAGLALTREAALPCREPVDDTEEEVWARALDEALEREPVVGPPALASTVGVCRRLRAVGPEVAATLESAEREAEDSPRRQREDWLRRLAVLVLVGVTAWLYCNRPEEPAQRPVYPESIER